MSVPRSQLPREQTHARLLLIGLVNLYQGISFPSKSRKGPEAVSRVDPSIYLSLSRVRQVSDAISSMTDTYRFSDSSNTLLQCIGGLLHTHRASALIAHISLDPSTHSQPISLAPTRNEFVKSSGKRALTLGGSEKRSASRFRNASYEPKSSRWLSKLNKSHWGRGNSQSFLCCQPTLQ